MKPLKYIIFIMISNTFFSGNASAQLEVKKHSKGKLVITFYNNSSEEKYFFNPGTFLVKKTPNRKKRNFIRTDRVTQNKDTTYVFLNDTSIVREDELSNQTDSANIKINNWKYIPIKPKQRYDFTIRFYPKIVTRYAVIYYNYDEKKKRKKIIVRL